MCRRVIRTVGGAFALLVFAATATAAPVTGADSGTQARVVDGAEAFPISAIADPPELYLGMNPQKYGTTSPVHVSGRTLSAGSGRVQFSVAGPKTSLTGTFDVGGLGTFEGVAFTPEQSGTYTISLVAPDGKGKAALEVVVHEVPGLGPVETTIDDASVLAEQSVATLETAVGKLPPSPARDDAMPRLAAARQALAKSRGARETSASVSALFRAVHSDSALSNYAGPRVASMAQDMLRMRRETQRVRDLTSGFNSATVACHQLALSGEMLRAASALLNVKKTVLDTAVGLSKDIIADFAGNAAKAGGASATPAFAVAQIVKNAPELSRASALAGNAAGILFDLGAFMTDTAFSAYCEQFVGPVHAEMEARFFQPQPWWNYRFKITARIVLYYPKNAHGSSIPVLGRLEGIAHSFETRENALSVMFPELMRSAVQKKVNFPPLEIGELAAETAVLGNGITSGYVEGSVAALALPNSFFIEVKGVVEKDSISLLLGRTVSDFSASHKVGVLILSPFTLVPEFTWYALPFQTAQHVFLRASNGQAMRLKLTRVGRKMVAEGTFTRPAPTSGGSRGAYRATIKACNPGC